MDSPECDVVIVGGGIVGLATAYQISQRYPERDIVVLEKEKVLAQHQSGRNSGVLHSGIYYRPGSLKAINCREGRQLMLYFCRENDVPHEVCGKLIVATDEAELPRLNELFERGVRNGVACERLDADQLRAFEPYCHGIAALHVKDAGIVDYRRVCFRLCELIQERGGQVQTASKVTKVITRESEIIVETTSGTWRTRQLINCAGLQSDRLAAMCGQRPEVKIVPFRGEYFDLTDEAQHLCRNLIYPVPDPAFPFLGVHFTRTTHGTVECGPNAVLAFAREGYTKWHINWSDLWETLRYRGVHRLAAKHWSMGMGEMRRSFFRSAFLEALQRLIPAVRAQDLIPAPAGIRAQALLPDGTLVDDFVIQREGRFIHVLNAPSPAATSSLNIGAMIADQL
ncbi:L-2-hydroxyglutarate oxidase [Blastopirellula marina]|uniref:L-2-hydroxyglutarate oxidase n=1 Tax=Blastopirellula marina TaxID=124 RepID=A0A2S8G1H2_9BACT|nr:L-2-hydroxyglutarate oxidase [Blastopirellula marina]PQO38289.1 L-2-hydroxyglutarate oxidase [Blastopirellula marina]PTL44945.1 L-2-hydroxyglutarate oxidase [Blastopirellula marina]